MALATDRRATGIPKEEYFQSFSQGRWESSEVFHIFTYPSKRTSDTFFPLLQPEAAGQLFVIETETAENVWYICWFFSGINI